MTHSRTVAKVFVIACYILLIPFVLAVVFSMMWNVLAAVIPIVVGSFGVYLLLGYRKHAKGELSSGKVLTLWFGTIGYNFLLLIPPIFFLFSIRSLSGINSTIKSGGTFASLYFALVSWQIISILLAASAVRSNRNINQSNGNVP